MKKALLLFLTSCWFGLVLGLSFIEAPLKFQAPGITTVLGLGIGKLVFGVLQKIEIVATILMSGLAFSLYPKMDLSLKLSIGCLIAIVLVQGIFLFPVLMQRVDLIIVGKTVASTYHHIVFIILECLKLIVLAFIFTKAYSLKL